MTQKSASVSSRICSVRSRRSAWSMVTALQKVAACMGNGLARHYSISRPRRCPAQGLYDTRVAMYDARAVMHRTRVALYDTSQPMYRSTQPLYTAMLPLHGTTVALRRAKVAMRYATDGTCRTAVGMYRTAVALSRLSQRRAGPVRPLTRAGSRVAYAAPPERRRTDP